jgi:Antitoxin Xre/MbcA/ParS C-terminal toxin-binding domain
MSPPSHHYSSESAVDAVQAHIGYRQSAGSFPIFGSANTPFSVAGSGNTPSSIASTSVSYPGGSANTFVSISGSGNNVVVSSEQVNQSAGFRVLPAMTRVAPSEAQIPLGLTRLEMLKRISHQESTLAGEQGQPLMGRMVYASARMDSASSLVVNETVERMKGRRTGPVQVLSKIAKDWQLSDAELARLLAYPDSQSAADLLDGSISLRDADREDRVRLLYGIYRILFSLFPEPPRQQAWLRGANQNLRDKSPLEFMIERRIPGMVSVKNLVERLAGR